mgnify:CR=1 FL=1
MAHTLALNKCPNHGTLSVSIDDADGCGVRLTSAKCCGRWEVMTAWSMTPAQWRDAAEQCSEAAFADDET